MQAWIGVEAGCGGTAELGEVSQDDLAVRTVKADTIRSNDAFIFRVHHAGGAGCGPPMPWVPSPGCALATVAWALSMAACAGIAWI